jgi:putative methionine-R-sulfoxide reductase with GAF domain
MVLPGKSANNRIVPAIKRAVPAIAQLPRTNRPKPAVAKPAASKVGRVAQLEEKIKHLEQSRDLTREFVSTTDMQKLMSSVFDKVITELCAEAGSLWLVDWKTGENVCQLAEGPNVGTLVGRRLKEGKGIVGDVIKTGDAVIVTNVEDDTRFSRSMDDKTAL